MSFRAVVVRKNEDGTTEANVENLTIDDLPGEGVLIDVSHSTLNYKDGLALTHGGGVVRKWPHVPGVDFAGTVIDSDDPRYQAGDEVLVMGWRVGEIYWGGYAEKARVPADFLIPRPKGVSAEQAMAVGTAGISAMYGLIALERQGVRPEAGPLLVTGASGGVGSIGVAIAANAGFDVTAVSGREGSEDYLRGLGAKAVLPRTDFNEPSKRPLESETWAGAIDTVGGVTLARVLAQVKYGGSVAAIGLAGGADLPATVIPFLLRGVNLLGIDSVMRPYEDRIIAWDRIVELLPFEKFTEMVTIKTLDDLPALGPAILKGQVRGRTVIDVRA